MDLSGLTIEAIKHRPSTCEGSLRAYATVRTPAMGVDVRGVGVHENPDGSRWLEMPHRVAVKADGTRVKVYTVRFLSAMDWQLWKNRVLEALADME